MASTHSKTPHATFCTQVCVCLFMFFISVCVRVGSHEKLQRHHLRRVEYICTQHIYIYIYIYIHTHSHTHTHTQIQWEMLAGLQETIPACVGICDHIASHTKEWKVWATSDSPHDNPLPSPWNDCINSFNTMCVLKIFRQEKLVFATEKYVMEKLGKSFTESPPVVLADIFPDTSARYASMGTCICVCMYNMYMHMCLYMDIYTYIKAVWLVNRSLSHPPWCLRIFSRILVPGMHPCVCVCIYVHIYIYIYIYIHTYMYACVCIEAVRHGEAW